MRRYVFTNDDTCRSGCRMEGFDGGPWVKWEDHQKEIERVTAEIWKHCPYDEWLKYKGYKAEKETHEKQIRELRKEIEGIEAQKYSKDIENRHLHAELEYANQRGQTIRKDVILDAITALSEIKVDHLDNCSIHELVQLQFWLCEHQGSIFVKSVGRLATLKGGKL